MAVFKLSGKSFNLDKDGVLTKTNGLEPGPIRKYTIEMHGKDYPIKQVVSHSTGLSVAEFTAHDAYRILKKMGFTIKSIEEP